MRILKMLHHQQSGQVLVIVLIAMTLGGIMMAPLLGGMNTGLKSVRVYETKMETLYAADAGIQEGIWKIARGGLPQTSSYSGSFPAFVINDRSVVTQLDYTWVLAGIADPNAGATPHNEWLDVNTTGRVEYDAVNNRSIYTVTLVHSAVPGNKKVDYIGVWLPFGFSYVPDSFKLFPTNIEKIKSPMVTKIHSGTSVVWSNLNFGFQQVGQVATQKFLITPVNRIPKGDVPWVRSQSTDIGYSWDNSVNNYKIVSTATEPQTGKSVAIEAHVARDTATNPPSMSILTYEVK